jgi:hypothetical protein
MLLTLLILAGSVAAAGSPAGEGVIEGAVVRAVDQSAVAGAEVILRAKVAGQMLTVAETTADAQGRFRFERLPADGAYDYLPGANRDGIHYPGPSVRLSGLRRRANVKLAVHDSVAFPNPLVVRRHEIVLCPQQGALQVTESMLIDNPSLACYVGQAAGKDAEPVTLQLAIPANFERVTFASEFFGRRFALIDGKLVTGVPWPPGQRELTFSYLLPNAHRHYVWQRPLDLPSANVRISVRGNRPERATCNLKPAPRRKVGEVAFEAGQRTLAAGHLLRVELGCLPVSVMTYAPWLALVVLAGLIAGTILPVVGRRTTSGKSDSIRRITLPS